MPSLAFIVPVHGRLALTAICLRQLRRTCDQLNDAGVEASAIIISDRITLKKLDPLALGFGIVSRDNQFLSRRFNDGIQLATDPKYNPNPVDYVVPCGSDDWVDHRLFLEPLPPGNEIHGFQWMSFVSEDGKTITTAHLNYEGGAGVRIIPRQVVAKLGYRPADEDRERACDTSILRNLKRQHGQALTVRHWHLHERQIVDWKSPGENLNSYRDVVTSKGARSEDDPFVLLQEFYPAEALEEMERHYHGAKVLA